MTRVTPDEFELLRVGRNGSGDGFNVCQHTDGEDHVWRCDACGAITDTSGKIVVPHFPHCYNVAMSKAFQQAAENARVLAKLGEWIVSETTYVEGGDTAVNRSLNLAYRRAKEHVRVMLGDAQ